MLKRILVSLATLFALAGHSVAQDPAPYKAQTASKETQTVKMEVLQHQLMPLTSEQVAVEADAWMGLLADTNSQISAARVARTNAGETGDDDNIKQLLSSRNGLAERFETVIKALKERGGDATKYEKYLAASTATGLSLTFVMDWIMSPEGGVKFGLNLLKFLLTLLAFKFISAIVAGIVRKAVSRLRGASDLLRDFLVNVVRRVTFFIGLIVALGMLGIDITPFVAALGAAGFVLGFALQGTLSNFAAGLMILIYRPYDIGEVIIAAGTTGKVDAMTLVSTTLRLPDNQTVIIPNNAIWGGVITNISGQATRRVDMVFGCGYGDDLQKAQSILEDIINNHPKVHKEPEPVIRVHELADSSVNFVVRPWTDTADYWTVFWDVTRSVKERFDAEGVSIPFPQRDVHVHQVND